MIPKIEYTNSENSPIIIKDREKETWFNKEGRKHREDGPAVIWKDGSQEWWLNGERHKEDGPAIITRGYTRFWYYNGKLHREDGPAEIWSDGYVQWWLNGNAYTFNKWLKQVPDIEESEKLILILTYR